MFPQLMRFPELWPFQVRKRYWLKLLQCGCVFLPMEHVPVSELWPRVRSDLCVMYTAAQFPVADVNDEEGLLKLAAVSCSRCFNPYHIALDCPNYPEDEVDEENPQAC